MATIRELVRLSRLQAMGGKLPSRKQAMRLMYVTPGFMRWASDKLPLIPSTHWGAMVPAKDQVISIIRDFRSGEKLDFTEQLNYLEPQQSGVWELKTGDVRIFGWFYDVDVYIASIGADANYIKRRSSQRYGKCISTVVDERNSLDIDPPKYVASMELRHVISN